MAARLRTETVLSLLRSAVRLHRGGAKSAKAKLASWMKANTHQAEQSPTETRIIDPKLQFDPGFEGAPVEAAWVPADTAP